MERALICIDDEVIVLDSLREQIENEIGPGFIIETCENGTTALEILNELKKDKVEVPLVIADYIMPNMTGDVVLERIVQSDPAVRTILLTGQANLKGIENAINNANLYRFISKPWDKDDLILTIKEAIRSYDADKTIHKQYLELKELNASLEEKVALRTQELEELNATKDKFFSIIAHDLKNPFNTLLGFSELLIENYDNYKDEKRKEFILLLNSISKQGFALLQNLLEWSRSQTGTIKLLPDYLNVNLIVEDLFKMLNATAIKKQISLVNNVAVDIKVFADENTLQTVLRNLLSNALKFTPKEGSITVDAKKKDDKMVLSVSDTGIGIPQEDLVKLFRIDINHSTVGTEEETGTGLGLILCKEFVEKNGGEIWVESHQNEGSTFYFTLPLKKTKVQ